MKSVFLCLVLVVACLADYQIGTGIADITAGPAGHNFMGYAQMTQRTEGIHMRLWSRSFIFIDKSSQKRFLYIATDLQACMQSVRDAVIKALAKKYGNIYTEDNVSVNGQHSHSGAGGYSHHVLYDRFSKTIFDKILKGILESVDKAHSNVKDGVIKVNKVKLYNSNINRSPTAYENNPEDERRRHTDGNTNKDMITLRIEGTDGKPMGAISWFSVHTTSVSNKNVYIHGDNKGIASYLFEKLKNGEEHIPGSGSFIAAFPIPPAGDISPNLRGAFCPNGQPCDRNSTCGGNSNLCHGIGPGKDDIESAMILGKNQFEAAVKAFEEAKDIVKGSIDYRHIYVNMSNVKVDPKYTSTGREEKTCRNALGMSFAAGTTDGPGGFNFHQGNNHTRNPFWEIIRDFVSKPTPEQIECQRPKPIFLDVAATVPYPWQPQILPLSVFKLGQVLFVNLPGEFSTMAGRRIEEQVRRTAVQEGLIPEKDVVVVLTTMSNAYIQYSTTYEEYRVQRYEGASTVFGPHTNSAYTQEIDKLVVAIARNQPIPRNPNPQDLSAFQISLNPGVVLDTHPPQRPFGSVFIQPKDTYKLGETVVTEFWAGHLDNNFINAETYLTIEKYVGDNWVVIKKDSDLNTRIRWRRHWRNVVFPDSRVIIDWKIENVTPGRYRITHYGWAKENAVSSKLTPYKGSTNPFSISN